MTKGANRDEGSTGLLCSDEGCSGISKLLSKFSVEVEVSGSSGLAENKHIKAEALSSAID